VNPFTIVTPADAVPTPVTPQYTSSLVAGACVTDTQVRPSRLIQHATNGSLLFASAAAGSGIENVPLTVKMPLLSMRFTKPDGPCGPVAPVAPVAPVGPVAPGVPCGPVGPVGPAGPAGPSGPAQAVSTSNDVVAISEAKREPTVAANEAVTW
jgi:hypothetical protein